MKAWEPLGGRAAEFELAVFAEAKEAFYGSSYAPVGVGE